MRVKTHYACPRLPPLIFTAMPTTKCLGVQFAWTSLRPIIAHSNISYPLASIPPANFSSIHGERKQWVAPTKSSKIKGMLDVDGLKDAVASQ